MSRRRRGRQEETSVVEDVLGQLRTKTYIAQSRRGEESGIWETEPVDYNTFLEHPDYLGLDMWGFSDAQKQVLDTVTDFENGVNHVAVFVGKGGGKNFLTRVMVLYLAYQLMCMRSPHAYLNLPEQEYITFLNVAASADQARSAFFDPLKEYFRKAGPKAFKDFGFDPDRDMMDREVRLPKNISVVSGHSAADSLEGRHILVAVADEIDGTAFQKPDKMWTMLRSSSRSRFNGKEKIVAISYSRYGDSNGMITKLYDQYADGKVPSGRSFKFPTWVFNPNPNITRETFESEFLQNPEEAETIYGCNPPSAALDAFIKDAARVKASMVKNENRHPLVFPPPPPSFKTFPLTEVSQIIDGKEVRIDPYDLEFQDWFRGKPGVEYIFIGDPGLGSVANGGDAYGICLGHRETVYDNTGKRMVRPVVDFVFRFTGHMFAEREIQFEAINRLIVNLKEERGFNITMFSFDLWNSVTIRQWLRRRYGNSIYINSERKYVRYEDFNLLRQRIFGEEPPSSGHGERMVNGGINWYFHEILYDEIINLIEDRQKRKVDHPSDNSKDMVDVVASFVYFALNKFPNAGVEVAAGAVNDQVARAMMEPQGGELSELDAMLKSLDKLSRDLRAPAPEVVGY